MDRKIDQDKLDPLRVLCVFSFWEIERKNCFQKSKQSNYNTLFLHSTASDFKMIFIKRIASENKITFLEKSNLKTMFYRKMFC
jgi:hypothetical protein